MRRSYKIVAVAVGAALLVGVLGIGAAFAADPPTPTGYPGYQGAVFTRVAEILGIDQQKLSDAFIQARTEQVDQAVKDGRLTQQQADWIKQRIQQAQQSAFVPGVGPGFGPRMRGGPMRGPGFGPGMGPGFGPGMGPGFGPGYGPGPGGPGR